MWYMAVLVRGAHVNGVLDEERLGDMLYCLVEATEAEGAHERALALGKDTSDTYDDEDGTSVTLSFLGLADLAEISAETLAHGVEVYSQLIPKKPAEMVVAKDELTVFESDEDGEGDEDLEDDEENSA
jgi:Domain of unknown function (DUF4288)